MTHVNQLRLLPHLQVKNGKQAQTRPFSRYTTNSENTPRTACSEMRLSIRRENTPVPPGALDTPPERL
ncbi:predicted protein [Sclerotinia sclerotiorum 1980 UF-70]|uniref:Uncharacterized protein n=1 Tax=Sclerotinia sclerotiorum (strain ATCC 18683 / 1980 / Ss-1) TaxID=665079 RepID=A7EAM5_SCLS1|nr:predicted protein [Sclerotinia sclerotiorum 1980 UF-70]EDN99503.1 predicted protein [Sclerotinia sclerotiorum 1980 UF-70]